MYPAVKRTIVSNLFNIYFIAFSLYYFFNSKLCVVCVLLFFFVKRSKDLYTLKITNNTSPRDTCCNVFNYKNSFRPFCNLDFCKNAFMFWYSNKITNFKFMIRIFNFFIILELIYVPGFTSAGFIAIVLRYVLLYSLTISSNLSVYTFFLILNSNSYKFFTLKF